MSDTAVRKAWRGKRGRWSLRLSGSDGRALGSSCKHNCGVHVSLTIRDFLSTRCSHVVLANYFLDTSLKGGHVYLIGRASKLLLFRRLPRPSLKLIFTVTDFDTRYENLSLFFRKRERVVSGEIRRFTHVLIILEINGVV